MTDVFAPAERSRVMSKIRSKNTRPELVVRSLLFAAGFRYRLHSNRLPGHPDLVLARWRTVVFVNGCFWHSHEGCRYAAKPISNEGFWNEKLRRNRERDERNRLLLKAEGWRVLVVWECACRKKKLAEVLAEKMIAFIIGGEDAYFEIGEADLQQSSPSED